MWEWIKELFRGPKPAHEADANVRRANNTKYDDVCM